MTQPWQLYRDTLPPQGVQQWSVPSKAVPGLNVLFLARMRMRWSGPTQHLSPQFDHWNGGFAAVPAGTKWRPPVGSPDDASFDQTVYQSVEPEGVHLERCPFCGEVPAWRGMSGGWGEGVLITAKPHEYNNWRLVCCSWAGAVPHKDPRQLAAERTRRLAMYRESILAGLAAAVTEQLPGHPQETPLSDLGSALGHLEVALYREPTSAPLGAAAWDIRSAVRRLVRGEPLNPAGLATDWAEEPKL